MAGVSSDNPLAPGAVLCEPGMIELNADRESKSLEVVNMGDRPIRQKHQHQPRREDQQSSPSQPAQS